MQTCVIIRANSSHHKSLFSGALASTRKTPLSAVAIALQREGFFYLLIGSG
ncbi:hypothetical protein [Porphyromonas circumdentaria]|uniref:hypothetical protein n=1 Tax=Porphyromonas circumdentaria TaxID=29524 RepID=UPI0013563D9B|nr:hypothetical protein [Porphyromonas circumdentaria]MBB6275468.1 hypothetical protein [Porphyromonas circumdentaria]MDO4722613.1 hypothetical protein [Porphyromonas circumdentaria]